MDREAIDAVRGLLLGILGQEKCRYGRRNRIHASEFRLLSIGHMNSGSWNDHSSSELQSQCHHCFVSGDHIYVSSEHDGSSHLNRSLNTETIGCSINA